MSADVRDLIGRWYAIDGNEAGGALHIVVDDGNVEDEFLDWCDDHCDEWFTKWFTGTMHRAEYRERCAEVIAALRALDEPERERLLR